MMEELQVFFISLYITRINVLHLDCIKWLKDLDLIIHIHSNDRGNW